MAIAAHPGDGMFTMGAAVAQHVHDGGKGIFLSLSVSADRIRFQPRNTAICSAPL